MTAQDERKASLEQRALAVITTSGTLVTLLFALVALLSKSEGFTLPKQAHGPLGAALVAFVAAALLALAVNLPRNYRGIDPGGLANAFAEWDPPKVKAQRKVARTQEDFIVRAVRVNAQKALVLTGAMAFEVAGVLAVAWAVGEVLRSS